MAKTILLCILCIMILGCGKRNTENIKGDSAVNVKETPGTKTNTSVNSDSLSYDWVNYEKYFKGSPSDNTEENAVYLKYSYPIFKGDDKVENINTQIRAYVLDSVYESEGVTSHGSFEKLEKDFFNDYKELIKERDFDPGYALDINTDIKYNKAEYLSVSISAYINGGGAHPNSFTRNMVFNPKTGKLLKLNDIFIAGFEKKLNELIDAKFRKDNNFKPNEKLSTNKDDRISLFKDKIEYNNNFIITKDGISFFYNPYEIAAYVYGPIGIDFTFEEIKSIMK